MSQPSAMLCLRSLSKLRPLAGACSTSHLAAISHVQAQQLATLASREASEQSAPRSSSARHAAWVAGLMSTVLASTAMAAENKSTPPASEPLTNHPLDFNPVTNEHTAKMTMARNAAMEYYQAGKYAQAEAKLVEALAEAKLGFDAKDPHIASAQNNLAEFYRNTRQYDKAEPLYKEALELLERLYTEKHWLYVSTMHNLALLQQGKGDLKMARTYMEKVLKLRAEMFGKRSFLYADSLYALGCILARQGGQSKQAIAYMKEAIGILEEAESVQVNVVLPWLTELAAEYQKLGKTGDAISALRRALYHFANDKGDVTAQSSQLQDELVALLLASKQPKEARSAQQACVTARTQLFGKQLVVAQSMTRLAAIEAGLGKGEPLQSAQQNALNAVALAQELLEGFSKPAGLSSLLKGNKQQDTTIKRVQAGHILGQALQQLAAIRTTLGAPTDEVQATLARGLEALEVAAGAARARLDGEQGKGLSEGDVEELSGQYVEVRLLQLELIDSLAEMMKKAGAPKEQVAELKQRGDEIAKELL